MRLRLFLVSLSVTMALSASSLAQHQAPGVSPPAIVRTEAYYRTELYFGRSVPGGGMVSDASWEEFLSEIVTSLFPDGFTVLSGRGQYREASGKIAKEPSHVLVFLYRKAERKTAGAKIDRIREEYKRRFSQESVLRIDSRKTSLVSF